MDQQSAETDILVALSLINARRFVLAAQMLRKTSKFYVDKYANSKNIMDLNRTSIDRTCIKQLEDQFGNGYSSITRTNFNNRILQGNRFLQRAAKIQILLAETISHPTLVLQKLIAYHRCNTYASGNISPLPLRPDADIEDISLTMFPQIISFFLRVLSDKLEPFRIAAIKSIEFFIETLGCSIGNSFLLIFKQAVVSYPCGMYAQMNSNRIPEGLHQIQLIEKAATQRTEMGFCTVKNKILIDHYHHLLETLFSLMNQINRKMVISIFSQILVPSVLNKHQSLELKLYLLRFIEKSFAICGADLNIEVSLVGLLLGFCQHKNISKGLTSSSNKMDAKSQNGFTFKQ